jgi:anti-sigma B factor antagonist
MAADVNRTTGGNVIIHRPNRTTPGAGTFDGEAQLGLSRQETADGYQVVSVTGELDIATAQQAYAYISDVIDHGRTPVSINLAGVTFCDASGLGVLAKIAAKAKEAGRQLRLTSARPSLLKIMRITGLDNVFPELGIPALGTALGTPALAHRIS